jgi:YfiH family protein
VIPRDWLVPDWPAPRGVHAVCTTRAGGVSIGRHEGLNLGDQVGDDPAAVRANRERLGAAIGVRPVFLRQVHGTEVVTLHGAMADGAVADGCATTERGIACAIMAADCLPVLFTDETGRRVAAAHAGWRGLAAGVLERTLNVFAAEGGAARVIAWLGPCIGRDAFEVGDEVRAAFESHAPKARQCFEPAAAPGKWMADLAQLARQRLRAAGVTRMYGNDSAADWCTVRNPLRFFSSRRDRVGGRFAACVWRS